MASFHSKTCFWNTLFDLTRDVYTSLIWHTINFEKEYIYITMYWILYSNVLNGRLSKKKCFIVILINSQIMVFCWGYSLLKEEYEVAKANKWKCKDVKAKSEDAKTSLSCFHNFSQGLCCWIIGVLYYLFQKTKFIKISHLKCISVYSTVLH